MSVLLNSRNVLHPQSVHQTYLMTYQRRTAISCLLLALFSEAIFILLMFKKIIIITLKKQKFFQGKRKKKKR
ncbi:hypothetical protein [Candidatus Lokiarchaeum ossiferum]